MLKNKYGHLIIVFVVFAILTAVFTFPLAFKINSCIPGFHSTDEPYVGLWHFWWAKYAHANGLDYSHATIVAAPFGINIQPSYFIWHSINNTLAITTNPAFTYNIQVLLSFIITGIIAYILAFYLTGNTIAAFFSAVIFSFCPYHFIRSWQHLGLAHIQWIPLYLLSLFHLYKNKTLKAAIFAGISFSLIMSFDLYYAYFMFISTILFLLYIICYERNFKRIFKFIELIFITAVVILVLESYDIFNTIRTIIQLTGTNTSVGAYEYVRPFEDLFTQSARPLSYFLPASSHPIFGKFTEQLVGSGVYGASFTEHTLFLGWVPLLFALFAVKKCWEKMRLPTRQKESEISKNENFYLGFIIILTFTAWLFSQPPWWNFFGLKLYMPSFFMYKIIPTLRAYCRFGIVVMLGVGLLAGFGLKFFIDRYASAKKKAFYAVIFIGLVIFEFWNYPPFKLIDVSRPPDAYYWLKEQTGDFTIAEYPLDTNGTNQNYLFYQTVHEKKVINGTIPGTFANKITKTITRLSLPETTNMLKAMGVKYIFVHREGYFKTELFDDREELDNIPGNKDLIFIKSFPAQSCPAGTICSQNSGQIDVYEIKRN